MRKIKYNPCKQNRSRLGIWTRLKASAIQHLADHAAACPRCQKRLALTNRVELAIGLLKSQRHDYDLLAKANTNAVNVLKHSLRQMPQSENLRHSSPKQNWIERKRPVFEKCLGVAACLVIVAMIRMGINSSLADVNDKGQKVVHNYYARNLDDQLFNEIFPDETLQA